MARAGEALRHQGHAMPERPDFLSAPECSALEHAFLEYLSAGGYLEDCFLVRTVWIEADSERKRMVNPRKAYPNPAVIPAQAGIQATAYT